MTRDYDPLTKLLHWLVFVAVAAQYTVGEFMPHIGRNAKDEGLIAWHFGLGTVVLVLIVVALIWRVVHPVPQTDEIALWQKRLATLVHWILYLLIFSMCLLGWAATNFRGWDVKPFGLVPLPALAAKGDRWAHTAGDIHTLLVNVLLGLVAVHVLAALYHHFIARDRVLKRML